MRRGLVAISLFVGSLGPLVPIAGCSLLTDLTSLSSGGPLADGGGTGDEAGKDSGGRAEAGDAGTGDGAIADAGGCGRYPDATFCVDFDQPNPFATSLWTENDALDPSPAGTIILTTSNPISAPNAASFQLAASTDNCRYDRLVKKVPGLFGSISTRFAVRAEDASVYFSLGVTVDANLRFTILIALGGDKLVNLFAQRGDSAGVTGIGGDTANLDLPWAGRWLSMSLAYQAQPTKGVSLMVPGARTLFVSLPAAFVGGDPQLTIGPYCSGTLTRATFDDFAFWLTP